jgi:hypothetical protein
VTAETFAFGELESGRFGFARTGAGSGLAAAFVAGEPAGHGDQLSVEVVEAERVWRVVFDAGGAGFELEFAGVGEPVGLRSGSEQLCLVTGTVTGDGKAERIECLGQRGHEPSAADGVALRRSLGAWLGPDEAVLARAERPADAGEHDAEALEVFIFEGEPPVAVPVADPRLTTQYDPEGRHVRAGLELWVGEEDDYARRVAGEVVCAASFDLDGARLDCAFLQWRMHGHEGAGIYDLLRAT